MEKDIKATFSKNSTTMRKIISAAFIVVFVLIIAAVNVLSVFLVKKLPSLEVDMTSSSLYSLSETTREYLRFLEEDVVIKVLKTEDAFVGVDSAFGYQANQLLKDMSGNKHISLEYVDMRVESSKTLQDKYPDVDWVNLTDVILVEAKESGKYRSVAFDEVFTQMTDNSTGETYITAQSVETAVLSAIQRVTSSKVVKAALTIGNGELFSDSAYDKFRSMLTSNAIDVEIVNINNDISLEDYELVIMMSPTYDITEETSEKLLKWLENDGNYGKNFLYIPFNGYLPTEMTNITLLLQQWGVKVTEGTIMEMDESLLMASYFDHLVNYVEDDSIFSLKDTSKQVRVAECRPIEILDNQMAKAILTSSEDAVVSLFGLDEEGNAYKEPQSGGYAAATISTKENLSGDTSNVFVWGSSPALSNSYTEYPNFSNSEYFLGVLGDLCGSTLQGVIIESAEFEGSVMTVTQADKNLFRTIFMFIIPVGFAAAGVVVWARRRNR